MINKQGSHARYLATRRFDSLDGLRFLSISAVIWHHLPVWPQLADRAVILARGHTGVDFFFVLSGFLITTLLLREKTAQGHFSLKAFYWRRMLRIVPIYFLVVTAAAVYAVLIKGEVQYLTILPYYPLFLSNFLVEHIPYLDPTWSLSMEEQYYLIWPALLLLLPGRWTIPALLLLIGVNVLTDMGFFKAFGLPSIGNSHFRLAIEGVTYAPILMGSLVAVLLHSRAGFSRVAPFLSFQAAPWLCLAALIIALASFPGALEGLPNLVVHSLMCLTLISLVVREDNGLAPILRLAPVVRIGQISYGVYLFHLFALAGVTEAFAYMGWQGWGWVFFAYYGLSIVMAEISFRTLETWFMNFRRKGWGRIQAS